MTKGTLIIGPADSGKTRKAREMASRYKEEEVVWLQQWHPAGGGYFYFSAISHKTKLVILDNVFDVDRFAPVHELMRDVMEVHRQGLPSIRVKVPEVIVVFEEEMSALGIHTIPEIANHFEIIDLTPEL